MRPRLFIVHHTATPTTASVLQIRDAHLRRGFTEIGYHFLIDQQGTVHAGRDVSRPGAHCKGYNLISVGVAWIGDARHTEPSPQAVDAIISLLGKLRLQFPLIPFGHGELCKTYCPGPQLIGLVRRLRASL